MTAKERLKEEDKDDVDKATAEPDAENEEKKFEEVNEEDEEDEEEEKKKKKKAKKSTLKADGSGKNPAESEAQSASSEGTISPGASTPSKPQDVFVPQSQVSVSREQTTPMGKSVEPDLLKSPLFVNISSQLDGVREALSKRLDAVEKSVNDRLNNVAKDVEKVEKFYKQSFYKAVGENNNPEALMRKSIKEQIAAGEVRYSQ